MSMVAEIRVLARPTSSVLKKRAVTIQNTKPKMAWMPVLKIRESALRTMLSARSDDILWRQPTGWDGAVGARPSRRFNGPVYRGLTIGPENGTRIISGSEIAIKAAMPANWRLTYALTSSRARWLTALCGLVALRCRPADDLGWNEGCGGTVFR
jgi:hypothetical protein